MALKHIESASSAASRRIRKVRRNDRIASWVITGGGGIVIMSVVGIFFLIATVATPLFFAPEITMRRNMALFPGLQASNLLAVGSDAYLETGYVLAADGAFTFFDWREKRVLNRVRVGGGQRVRAVEKAGGNRFSLLWLNGAISIVQVVFSPRFDAQGQRSIAHQVQVQGLLTATAPPAKHALARYDEEQGVVAVRQVGDDLLTLTRIPPKSDFLSEEKTRPRAIPLPGKPPSAITALALDKTGERLYVGTQNGYLLWWRLEHEEPPRFLGQVQATDSTITALVAMPGDAMVVLGTATGELSTWQDLPDPEHSTARRLVSNHTLRPHAHPVRRIAPSLRTRSLVSSDEKGNIHFDHSTNERPLLKIGADAALWGISPRFNALAMLDTAGRLQLWEADIPHPEAGWNTYFNKIWYGSYAEPKYVWQSSSGDDDFEPKLSLIPLIFGTLKGALYGMLFAMPLAIFGATYTSHLMHPGLRRIVKPTVEIMGSVPSVVVGFLAALWLAPILKVSLIALVLIIASLPLVVLGFLMLWECLIPRLPVSIPRGYEFLLLGPLLVLLVTLSFRAGVALEDGLFGGDLTQWLYTHWELRFDQRNAIVIAFALGFAVIPIVFTIADDALVNIPRTLTAASLALGASRWQTVWRVVLPSASPGIFAALMVGTGRAVGETMIVLMATGNTPVMDWGAFSGMRTLSANIAVEIPEAPFESTLYRTLFMSAILLFMMTFALNSAAEVVQQWLRRKYTRY